MEKKMKQVLKRLSECASAANLKEDYKRQAAYNKLHNFFSNFGQEKNKVTLENFVLILRGVAAHIIATPTLSLQDFEHTIQSLETACELAKHIMQEQVSSGKEQMKATFLKYIRKQKKNIAGGAHFSLEALSVLNETMRDLLVNAYGMDSNTLPDVAFPAPKTVLKESEKASNTSGFQGFFKTLFKAVATPEGMVAFFVPLLRQIIDNFSFIFFGDKKAHPIVTEVKSAIEESLEIALAQTKAGPQAHNKDEIYSPYFNLFQRLGNQVSPLVEQEIRPNFFRRP